MFETGSAAQRMAWAISLVRIPPGGITPAKLYLKAGLMAGLTAEETIAVIKAFHRNHGRNRIIYPS